MEEKHNIILSPSRVPRHHISRWAQYFVLRPRRAYSFRFPIVLVSFRYNLIFAIGLLKHIPPVHSKMTCGHGCTWELHTENRGCFRNHWNRLKAPWAIEPSGPCLRFDKYVNSKIDFYKREIGNATSSNGKILRRETLLILNHFCFWNCIKPLTT